MLKVVTARSFPYIAQKTIEFHEMDQTLSIKLSFFFEIKKKSFIFIRINRRSQFNFIAQDENERKALKAAAVFRKKNISVTVFLFIFLSLLFLMDLRFDYENLFWHIKEGNPESLFLGFCP